VDPPSPERVYAVGSTDRVRTETGPVPRALVAVTDKVWPTPAVTLSSVGTPARERGGGVRAGQVVRTVALRTDGTPVPTAFFAVTVNE
jgi:hypothetical protein